MQNPDFGSKMKIPKNMSKSILQTLWSCFVQKTAQKNIKYSRNETTLKKHVFCTEQLQRVCRMEFDMFFGILIFDKIQKEFYKILQKNL